MKKTLFFFLFLSFLFGVSAQVSKTVSVTAGSLSSVLSAGDLNTVTELIVTGTIDVTDFVTIKSMRAITSVDLSGTTILANGANLANAIPANALANCSSLRRIVLPAGITTIGRGAFSSLYFLNSISIPASVTIIGDQAFRGCEVLTSITLPSELITLDYGAFEECYALTSIEIPAKVTTLGYDAFTKCYALKTAIIPPSVTSYNFGIFQGCDALTNFVIPETVTSIGDQAFYGAGLTSVVLPPSVKTIGQYAFRNCSKLTSITVPASVSSIGNGAFLYSTGAVNVDPANPYYSSIDGVLFDKAQTTLIHVPVSQSGSYAIPSTVSTINISAFERCKNLTSITIPSSVTTIGNLAFSDCYNLTSLTLPASVASIGAKAFSNCAGASSFYVYSDTPVNLTNSMYVFYMLNTSTCVLYVPKDSKTAYQNANQWKDFANIVEMNTCIVPLQPVAFPSNASTSTFSLTSNTSWTVSSNQSWLNVSVSSGGNSSGSKQHHIIQTPTTDISGSGNASLQLSAAENTTGADRTAIVTITATAVPVQSFTVTQSHTPENPSFIKPISGNILMIYPNPVINEFAISCATEPLQMRITDINGRLVNEKTIALNASVSVRTLPIGIYMITLVSKNSVTKIKLIKQ